MNANRPPDAGRPQSFSEAPGEKGNNDCTAPVTPEKAIRLQTLGRAVDNLERAALNAFGEDTRERNELVGLVAHVRRRLAVAIASLTP